MKIIMSRFAIVLTTLLVVTGASAAYGQGGTGRETGNTTEKAATSGNKPSSRPRSGSRSASSGATPRQLAAAKHFETGEKMLADAKCWGCGDKTSGEVILVEAINEYRLAVQLDPDNVNYRIVLGSKLMSPYDNWRKFDEAEVEFRRAVEINPEGMDAHRALAESLLRQKKFSQAETEYRLAVRLAPTNYYNHKELGFSLLLQQKYSDAEVEYRAALRLFDDTSSAAIGIHAGINQYLGQTLYYQGKFAEAQGALERCNSDNAKEDIGFITYACHFWLARVFKEQNKLQQSENEYRKALELYPEHELSKQELNEVLRLQGK